MAPRLRKDLVATTADEQGVACVEVSDPGTGTSFRFYDFEYALALELTGQPLEAVVSWAQATYGIELSAETLDQFLEKLAGLGFLEGTSSGAQPAILAPFSPSSSSHPFGDLPTTVAVDGAPVLDSAAWAPPLGAKVEAAASPPQAKVDAAAPQGIISADAREYGLRDAGSGLWERPDGFGAGTDASTSEPLALLPKLEILAGPLPPVAAQPGTDSATPQLSATPATGRPVTTPAGGIATVAPPPAAVTFPMASDMPKPATPAAGLSIPVRWPPPDLSALGALGAPSPFAAPRAPARSNGSGPALADAPGGVDTPLASVADAIAASITRAGTPGSAADPLGAGLDSGPAGERAGAGGEDDGGGATGDVAFSSLATAHLRRSERAGGEVSPPPSSWARDLADEVDRPAAAAVGSDAVRAAEGQREKHQPPPEVVVIPPMSGGVPRTAVSSSHSVPAAAMPTRRRPYAFPVILLLVAVASGAVWFFRSQQLSQTDEGTSPAPASSVEAAPQVHVVSPQPTTFYRWFETAGAVTPGQDEKLAFRASGRVQELMPPGTTFAAGETIGRLFGVAERELAVNRLRSRVSYYEQLRDSSRAEGGGAASQQAEAKLTARRQELTAAQAALAAWEIRPRVPGVIAQSFAAKGTLVKAGTPVLHVRSSGPRATFPLSGEEAAKARALGFCRLETVPGTGGGGAGGGSGAAGNPETAVRAIDCAVGSAAAGTTAPMAVDLVGASAVPPGTQVRLASARYDGVFPVPRAGLMREGGVDHVWVVSGGGRFAERRTVEVVATVDDLALVGHGIAVGEAVIVDPPATLKAGAEINVAR